MQNVEGSYLGKFTSNISLNALDSPDLLICVDKNCTSFLPSTTCTACPVNESLWCVWKLIMYYLIKKRSTSHLENAEKTIVAVSYIGKKQIIEQKKWNKHIFDGKWDLCTAYRRNITRQTTTKPTSLYSHGLTSQPRKREGERIKHPTQTK